MAGFRPEARVRVFSWLLFRTSAALFRNRSARRGRRGERWRTRSRNGTDESRIRKQSGEEGLECFKLASHEVASALSRLKYRAAEEEKASLFNREDLPVSKKPDRSQRFLSSTRTYCFPSLRLPSRSPLLSSTDLLTSVPIIDTPPTTRDSFFSSAALDPVLPAVRPGNLQRRKKTGQPRKIIRDIETETEIEIARVTPLRARDSRN